GRAAARVHGTGCRQRAQRRGHLRLSGRPQIPLLHDAVRVRRRRAQPQRRARRAARPVQRGPAGLLRGRSRPADPQAAYFGFLNFRMNWSVWPWTEESNTLAVCASSLLRRTSLAPSYLKPADSTSFFTASASTRCWVFVSRKPEPASAA